MLSIYSHPFIFLTLIFAKLYILLEFGLAFSWLLLLLQNIENLSRFGHNLFLVKVVEEDSALAEK